MRKIWMFTPHSGGIKIPPATQEATRKRILAYAEKHYAGKFTRIDVRFKCALCYIDAYKEPFAPKHFRSFKITRPRARRRLHIEPYFSYPHGEE